MSGSIRACRRLHGPQAICRLVAVPGACTGNTAPVTVPTGWNQPDPALENWLAAHREAALGSFRSNPHLVSEQGAQEDSFRTGGYADRQVLELVQNAADASNRGRVELRLVGGALYCANEGRAFTEKGLIAICQAYLSAQDGAQMGRFGLGFKSVLGVTSQPFIFSRSVSVGFDASRAREELSRIAPAATAYPVLRLPYEVDVATEMAADPVLADLARWAVTVVRLSLDQPSEALMRDLKLFPKEFLLFAPTVATMAISMSDGASGESSAVEYRCIVQDGPRVTLVEDGQEVGDWLVWHRQHRHSQRALGEVGRAIKRDEVRVSYAVPTGDATTLGRFWAYFPLHDQTSTRGIHNAPWRINDDRTSLIDGLFNRELLDVLAEMVVEGIPSLSEPGDPARHFDYLPARGREENSFAGRYLSEVVPSRARLAACVPNADGVLQQPVELHYPHFDLKLTLESFGLWDKAPGRPVRSPHWTCYKNATRAARLRTLVRFEENVVSDLELGAADWLGRIVEDSTDAQVEAALRVLFSVRDENTRRDMLAARVLPDATNSRHRLHSTKDVFLRGNVLSAAAGLQLVRPSLLDRKGVEESLRQLGFEDVDPSHELRRLATTAARKWTAVEWSGFWDLVAEVKVTDAQEILSQHAEAGSQLRVRCKDGKWHDVGAVVVAGVVNPVDPGLALDTEFHELHLGLLQNIGVSVTPVTATALMQDLTFLEYLRLQRQAYLEELPARGRPDATSLHFRVQACQGPLHVLRRFQDTGDTASCERWTRELLQMEAPTSWSLVHINPKAHPQREVLAPHLWAAERYGLLRTAWGPRPANRCLAANLGSYAPLLPVAQEAASHKVVTIATLENVPVDLWREFLARVPAGADAWSLGALLVKACRRVTHGGTATVPALAGADGDSAVVVAPDQLLLARDEEERRVLARRSIPHVAVVDDEDADLLIGRWGCRAASSLLRVEIVSETPGEPVLLLDRYRGLRAVSAGHLDGLELVQCSDLARQVTGPDGLDSEATDFARSGTSIFCLVTMADETVLARISDDFGLALSTGDIERILGDAYDEQVKKRVAASRAAATNAERLLALLSVATLESNLPKGLLDTVRALSRDDGPLQVADLLLQVHGHNVLVEMRHALDDAGYKVPQKWAGTDPAVVFVRSLGFVAEYAGSRGRSLDSDVTVLGPPRLDPLHDYQALLAQDIRDLVRPDGDRGRALLYLPTGAGKTRVTVEALAHAFMQDGLAGPLLWIAQSDELCEQAVQTWQLIWRQFGDRPLRVCRLWDSNEVAESEDALTVIVATDAKLDRVRGTEGYEWLSDASAVVIDEAHTATGEGIGRTLAWLGIEGKRTERPLLGLTATPFKGRGEDANRRLAHRFGKRVFNRLGDDPHGELQRRKVLAKVQHRTLPGASVELDPDERSQVRTFNTVPQAVLERLGRDEARTMRLVDDITGLDPSWPVLVFTASVVSAQTLAVLLRVRGVEAASVSGATRMSERRRNIEAFKRGEIRVLTNCAVLTQGFDAPAVRALYIAKPTFSPNAYIQMVGRGLRGVANGGTEECLVVNVADTGELFGDRLAFNEFDYLWDGWGADAEPVDGLEEEDT